MAKLKKAKILIVFASSLLIISSASYEVYGSKRRARAAQYDDIEPSYKKRKLPPSYQYDPSNSNSNSNSGGPGNANSVNPLMSNSYQSVPPQNQYPSANAISNPSNHPYMSVFDLQPPTYLNTQNSVNQRASPVGDTRFNQNIWTNPNLFHFETALNEAYPKKNIQILPTQSRLDQKVQEFKDLVKAAHQPVKNQSRPISQNGQPQGNIYQQPQGNIYQQPQGNIYQQPQNNVSRKHEDNIMSQQYNSNVSLQHMTNVGQQQALYPLTNFQGSTIHTTPSARQHQHLVNQQRQNSVTPRPQTKYTNLEIPKNMSSSPSPNGPRYTQAFRDTMSNSPKFRQFQNRNLDIVNMPPSTNEVTTNDIASWCNIFSRVPPEKSGIFIKRNPVPGPSTEYREFVDSKRRRNANIRSRMLNALTQKKRSGSTKVIDEKKQNNLTTTERRNKRSNRSIQTEKKYAHGKKHSVVHKDPYRVKCRYDENCKQKFRSLPAMREHAAQEHWGKVVCLLWYGKHENHHQRYAHTAYTKGEAITGDKALHSHDYKFHRYDKQNRTMPRMDHTCEMNRSGKPAVTLTLTRQKLMEHVYKEHGGLAGLSLKERYLLYSENGLVAYDDFMVGNCVPHDILDFAIKYDNENR
eukprot:225701_1